MNQLVTVGPNVFIAFYMIHLLTAISRLTAAAQPILYVGWFMLAGAVVAGSFYFHRLASRRRSLWGLTDGFLIRNRKLKMEFTPWTDVSRVHPLHGAIGVAVWIKSRRTVESLRGFFKSAMEVDQFVGYASRIIAGSAANPNGPVPNSHECAVEEPRESLQAQSLVVELPLPSVREPRALPYAAVIITFLAGGIAFALLRMPWARNGFFAAAAVSWLVSLIWSSTGPKIFQRLRITKGGFLIMRGDDELFAARWQDFEVAAFGRTESTMTVHGRYGAILFVFPGAHPLRPKMLTHAVAEINRHRAQFLTQDA